ncbi:hypothetical protein JCM17380_19110 [Desulfosporosinus burensis]
MSMELSVREVGVCDVWIKGDSSEQLPPCLLLSDGLIMYYEFIHIATYNWTKIDIR